MVKATIGIYTISIYFIKLPQQYADFSCHRSLRGVEGVIIFRSVKDVYERLSMMAYQNEHISPSDNQLFIKLQKSAPIKSKRQVCIVSMRSCAKKVWSIESIDKSIDKMNMFAWKYNNIRLHIYSYL